MSSSLVQSRIRIPALVDGGEVIIPGLWLGRIAEEKVQDGYHKFLGVEYCRRRFCAADYLQFGPPTLAELRYAFFGKKPDGSWVSKGYRNSVLSTSGHGEWTSTFVRDGKKLIERPERVFYDRKHRLWIAEGGKVFDIELQKDGWVIEYDSVTGFPSRIGSEEEAGRAFGEDKSYFRAENSGLAAVMRDYPLPDGGPFFVNARFSPGNITYWSVGARSCQRMRIKREHVFRPYTTA